MLDKLRRGYAQLVTSGAQLLLVFFGIYQHSRNGWLYCLSAISLISVFAWLSALNRLRTIRDTPTSKIGSAAQGYVELIGRGQPIGGDPLLSDLSRRSCLWCRYKIEQLSSEREWKTVDSGESIFSFILSDDTGECVVDPEHAEISTRHYNQWTEDDSRYSEWLLLQNDLIHVIGQLRTQGSSVEFDTREELNELLTEWKKDMPALLARFDLDKDGALDMEEWQLARQAAKREVEKVKREAQAQPDINFVGQPPDGKFFMISNIPEKTLFRRYLLWAWAHLVIFFGSLGGIGWVLQQ